MAAQKLALTSKSPQYGTVARQTWNPPDVASSPLQNGACWWYQYWNALQCKLAVFNRCTVFLISNFHRVLNVVCFLLGNSPLSEFYMPMFWNTLSVLSSGAGRCEEFFTPTHLLKWYSQRSETSACKIQTPGNYAE